MDLEKRWKISVKGFIIACIVFTISLILLIYFSKPAFPNIQINDLVSPISQEYTLVPEGMAVEEPLIPLRETLYVTTNPKDYLRYVIVLAREWYNYTINKKYNALFMAEKRLMEIERFNANYIYIFPPKSSFNVFENMQYYMRSWGNALNRYQQFVTSYTHKNLSTLSSSNKQLFYELLTEHENRLMKTIYKSSLTDNQKKLLIQHAFNFFTVLWKKIQPLDTVKSKIQTSYSLHDLIKNKDWGIYDIQINDNLNKTNRLMPSINNQFRYPIRSDNQQKNLFSHISIDPQVTNNKITLSQSPILQIVNQWKYKELVASGNAFPVYRQQIEFPENATEYQLNLTINNSIKEFCSLISIKQYISCSVETPTIQLIRMYTEKATILKNRKKTTVIVPKEEIVASSTLYPKRNSLPRILTYTTPKTINSTYELRIYSNLFIPQEIINNVTIDIFIRYEPDLLLIKKQALNVKDKSLTIHHPNTYTRKITTNYLTETEVNMIEEVIPTGWKIINKIDINPVSFNLSIIFLPFIVLRNVTILTFLTILTTGLYLLLRLRAKKNACFLDFLFSKPSLNRIINTILTPVYYGIHTIDTISIRFRIFFLVISLTGFVWDIYILKRNSDFITTILTTAWTFTMIGYRAESRNSFALALVFLITCPFLLIFKQDFIAEKAAIWTYMLLVVGTFQSIIELKKPGVVFQSFPDFYLNRLLYSKFWIHLVYIKTPIQSILVNIYHKYIFFQKIIKISIVRFMGELPQTKFQWAKYVAKLTSLIVGALLFAFIALTTFSFFFVKCSDLYKQYREYRTWNNIKPRIYEIEPRIIYPGQKVILRGKNFGWSEIKGYLIGTNQPPYVDLPDLWNDTKVIFTVPLHWKVGVHPIFIQKPVLWNEKYIPIISNMVNLTIIPRSHTFTEQDDVYFEELNKVSKEARKINGYE